MNPWDEHYEYTYNTDLEIAEYNARVRGIARPDCMWLCTSLDTWVINPYYHGEPQPHPEMIGDDDE